MSTLVLGTANRNKVRELAILLAPTRFRLLSLADFSDVVDVPEGEHSLAENARRKAALQAARLGQWVLGDDTGLEVDALSGAPGVLSSRYAGLNAGAAANRRRLLDQLANVPFDCRTARFVCRLALADPSGQVRAEAEGHCCGRILFEPAGDLSFGYDSLFEIVEYHRTLAQLGSAAQFRLTHRARAVERILPDAVRLIG
ncbi:MAG: non-canonical purine NTP pyrophosphatase [Rhodopirellula sp.]|nr:non-canonical purine NTP pyrophosphatase [Rhodopirellula sp.]